MLSAPPFSLLLVESNDFSRQLLVEHLESSADLSVLLSAPSIADAFGALESYVPDVAVVASYLSDGSALSFLNRLDQKQILLPSIVLASSDRITHKEAVEAGAAGRVFMDLGRFDLIEAIRAVRPAIGVSPSALA